MSADLRDIEATPCKTFLVMAAIKQFRRLLDIMEQFIGEHTKKDQENHE